MEKRARFHFCWDPSRIVPEVVNVNVLCILAGMDQKIHYYHKFAITSDRVVILPQPADRGFSRRKPRGFVEKDGKRGLEG